MIDIDLLLDWGAAYKKVRAGEVIFTEGHSCFFYYQMVSGKIRWVNINDEGRECLHLIAGPGECFGELPLFDDEPYAATAIADEDCLLLRLHKPIFLQLIAQYSNINLSFTKHLSKRLRYKLSIIKSYATHCPENSITNLLNNLKAENKSFCGQCNRLTLTRQQIADMTGLRVETVIRTMRNMHNKGQLYIEKGKVYCNNKVGEHSNFSLLPLPAFKCINDGLQKRRLVV